jgi:hypothetical protein
MYALSSLLQVLAHVPPMQRERVAQLLMMPNYLRKLLDIFRVSSTSCKQQRAKLRNQHNQQQRGGHSRGLQGAAEGWSKQAVGMSCKQQCGKLRNQHNLQQRADASSGKQILQRDCKDHRRFGQSRELTSPASSSVESCAISSRGLMQSAAHDRHVLPWGLQ